MKAEISKFGKKKTIKNINPFLRRGMHFSFQKWRKSGDSLGDYWGLKQALNGFGSTRVNPGVD